MRVTGLLLAATVTVLAAVGVLTVTPGETAGPNPGFSLAAPTSALLSQTFVLVISANPAPTTGVSQIATEVELPSGLVWVQRANCAGAGTTGEFKPTVGGVAPSLCYRAPGPAGEARHYVASEAAAPPNQPAFTPQPLTTLLRLDIRRNALGTFTMNLTMAWQDAYGAFYGLVDGNIVYPKTISVGGYEVAATRQITCLDPNVDTDLDGCTNGKELGTNATLGGKRDPLVFWDFYDVPTGTYPNLQRDKAVAGTDLFAVLARNGATGSPSGDPLSPPPAAPAYHTAYDRTAAVAGTDPWDSGPPNGSISSVDTDALQQQMGHTCQ